MYDKLLTAIHQLPRDFRYDTNKIVILAYWHSAMLSCRQTFSSLLVRHRPSMLKIVGSNLTYDTDVVSLNFVRHFDYQNIVSQC